MKKVFCAFLALVMCFSCCLMSVSAEGNKTSSQSAKSGTYAADNDSIIGKWYDLEDYDAQDIMTMYFYKSGKFKAVFGNEKAEGKYTLKNGLLKMVLTYEDETETAYFSAVISDGLLYLGYLYGKEDFKPYKKGADLGNYLGYDAFALSKEKPVPANQKDVLGSWAYFTEFEEQGVVIFNEKSITEIELTESFTDPIVLKNGKVVAVGKLPDNVELDDETTWYLCGDTLFCGEFIMKRFKNKTLTKEMLESAVDETGLARFSKGKAYISKNSYSYKISKSSVSFGDYSFKYYVTDNRIYLVSKKGNLVLERK